MACKYQRAMDYANGIPDFNYHNGLKLTLVEDNYAEARVELTMNSMNPQGIAHGGLLFALCDFVGGWSVCGDSKRLVTQDGSFNFLRPVRGSFVRAEGRPVKVGRTIAVVDTLAYDEEDSLVARGTFTYFILSHEDPEKKSQQ